MSVAFTLIARRSGGDRRDGGVEQSGEVGGVDREVEAATTTADVDRVEEFDRFVEHRAQRACADPAG